MASAFERLTDRSRTLVTSSQKKAKEYGLREIDTNVLLLAMLDDEDSTAADTLRGIRDSIGLQIDARILRALDEQSYAGLEIPDEPQFGSRTVEVFGLAHREATAVSAAMKDPEHILLSILRHDDVLQRWLDRELSSDFIYVYVALRDKMVVSQTV